MALKVAFMTPPSTHSPMAHCSLKFQTHFLYLYFRVPETLPAAVAHQKPPLPLPQHHRWAGQELAS